MVSSEAQARLRQALVEMPTGEAVLGPTCRNDVAAQPDVTQLTPARMPPMPRNDSMCKQARQLLPVFAYRAQILSTINRRRVVVIEGQTGCGKTTQVCSITPCVEASLPCIPIGQVPQFVIVDAAARGTQCNIICTQPRRISAI